MEKHLFDLVRSDSRDGGRKAEIVRVGPSYITIRWESGGDIYEANIDIQLLDQMVNHWNAANPQITIGKGPNGRE